MDREARITVLRKTARRAQRLDLPRPFVKWAGGKGQLVEALLALAPREFGAYHEPFVGGAALFFALQRNGCLAKKKVFLSDVNSELMDTYRAIRDRVSLVIRQLESHRYDPVHYYAVRELDPKALSPEQLAARMIFLNRTGFNGLYRVNRQGRFNVPFGSYTNPTICDSGNLRAAAEALQGAELSSEPFEAVLNRARSGDLVYFDPPYVPLSETANFVSYARDGFGVPDQERLARVFESLDRRGVRVMLSNSDAPWVRERYQAYCLVEVQARRNVNSRGDRRGPIGELVVVNYDP